MPDTPQEARSSQEQPAQGSQVSTDAPEPSEAQNGSEETFSKAYVERLRAENREAREQASRADFLATEVRRLALREGTRGILADPEALAWSDDFAGEDGLPDPAKITAAAEALATAKPWLARVRGSVRQGEHGTEQPASVSLSELLRAG